MNNLIQEKPKQILLGLYVKEYWAQYNFRIIELFTFDRFFNWAISGQMTFIEIKDTQFYLLDYKRIAPSWGMSVILLKKIMLHLSGSLGQGVTTMLKFPLMRITKQENNIWKSYFGFEKGVMNQIIAWDYLTPKRKIFIKEFFEMNNVGIFSSQELLKLNPPKQDKTKIICKLFPQVESILIDLNELQLDDKKTLFSYPKPIDHFIHTDSVHRFQKAVQNIYLGTFEDMYIIEEKFLERNKYYITDVTYKKIKECKNDWDKVKKLIIDSAKHYLTWFEEGREPQNKTWLPRDIGTWMYDPMKHGSMFLLSILYKSTLLREKVAENMYNKLPAYISNKFSDFYKDEWDGLAYWNKIYSVYKWYKDNSEELIQENNNYRYWFQSVNKFMDGYYDFINMLSRTKYLKHFGINNPTWNWFISSKKEEHGIEE
jgi:hypothetical protein